MKFKNILFYSIAILSISSCKEQIPSGLVLNPIITTDTSYIDNVIEIPQLKKVVIEELTGVRCPNCPTGTQLIKDFVAQNPDRIIVTAIHSGFFTDPLPDSKYDFRNADADAFRQSFPDGDPPKPSAAFDRVPYDIDKYFVVKGQGSSVWQSALTNRLSKSTPVNIHLNSDYDIANNKVNVKVQLNFTENVSDKLALSLYVLDGGKKDIQDSLGNELHDYEFDHILAKTITSPMGEPILDTLASIEKGRVLIKLLSFQPYITTVNAWNLDKCKLVAIIHKTGNSREVLHAEEISLK